MEIRDIDSIAYLISEAKKHNKPKPIVLLGAGVSVTAGIPLANKIMLDIIDKFADKPEIKAIKEEDRDYYSLMGALTQDERNNLLRDYIRDEKVKINVSHIYLAQLLKFEYVDFVLTVNFDDLVLRACALFNFLPPVYDITTLSDFTTTSIQKQSVTYLHGQHHGLWLLNSPKDLDKVKESVPKLLERICNGRTWIVVGYSGEDEVIEHISKIGSFANNLYWVGYKENEPSENVKKKLLYKQDSNAFYVKGYDADTFFLKLSTEVKKITKDPDLETPQIFNKPFSFLKDILNNIKDVEIETGIINPDHRDLYHTVNERLVTSKNLVKESINEYEEKDSVDKFIRNIIEDIINSNFENIKYYLNRIEKETPKFDKAKKELANLVINYGNSKGHPAMKDESEELYRKVIEIYEIAHELDPENSTPLYNWGTMLSGLGRMKRDPKIYEKSCEMYKKSLLLNPKQASVYCNWGSTLKYISDLTKDVGLLAESVEKYKKSIEIEPDNILTRINLGISLSLLGKYNKDKGMFEKSFDEFGYVIKKFPEDMDALDNWVAAKLWYSYLMQNPKERTKLIKDINLSAQKVYDKIGSSYNLACTFALLGNREEALKYLKRALERKDVRQNHVLEDEDWKLYRKDEEFIELFDKL